MDAAKIQHMVWRAVRIHVLSMDEMRNLDPHDMTVRESQAVLMLQMTAKANYVDSARETYAHYQQQVRKPEPVVPFKTGQYL